MFRNIFSPEWVLFKSQKYIADQANIALFSLLRKIRHFSLPIDMQIDLFNKMIKPILLYGCELWGFGNIEIIERVQLKFLKHILHLKKSTPSFMIYGELGVYPLKLDIQSRTISYWAKVSITRPNYIASMIYDGLYSLNETRRLKNKWLDNIKHLLCSNGYGNVWENQTNFNVEWLNKSFKQRLKDSYLQNWNSLVDKSSSGLNYRLFKQNFELNKYFTYLPINKCRLLTAFRSRNHRLPIEVGRWASIPVSERKCQLCNDGIGDEFHYVLECKTLNEQRRQYINASFVRNPNTIKFHSLMNNNNKPDNYAQALSVY